MTSTSQSVRYVGERSPVAEQLDQAISITPGCKPAAQTAHADIVVVQIAAALTSSGADELRCAWPKSLLLLLVGVEHFTLSLIDHCDGVLRLNPTAKELASALSFLCTGGYPLGPEYAGLAATPSEEALLTERETQIVALHREGYQFKEIATNLGISARTVYHYASNARKKLGVKNLNPLRR